MPEASCERDSTVGGNQQKTAGKSGGRPGPRAALQSLLDSGFFADPRTIQHAQLRLEESRGYRYEQHELSTPLVRKVRSDVLAREKNDDGQYEYRVAG